MRENVVKKTQRVEVLRFLKRQDPSLAACLAPDFILPLAFGDSEISGECFKWFWLGRHGVGSMCRRIAASAGGREGGKIQSRTRTTLMDSFKEAMAEAKGHMSGTKKEPA